MEEEIVKKIVDEVIKKVKGNMDFSNYAFAERFPVSASNRHVHLSQKDIEILFGKECRLTNIKNLSQPGQFACQETVKLIGQKGMIDKVRILGPVRSQTQVEVSITDSRSLGMKNVPVRDSGDLKGTGGIAIAGPCGVLNLEEGLIIALRHIHMKPDDARSFGLKDKEFVKVRVESGRPLIFENVLIRVSENYSLDMHIDTDEANAAGIKEGDFASIVK